MYTRALRLILVCVCLQTAHYLVIYNFNIYVNEIIFLCPLQLIDLCIMYLRFIHIHRYTSKAIPLHLFRIHCSIDHSLFIPCRASVGNAARASWLLAWCTHAGTHCIAFTKHWKATMFVNGVSRLYRSGLSCFLLLYSDTQQKQREEGRVHIFHYGLRGWSSY